MGRPGGEGLGGTLTLSVPSPPTWPCVCFIKMGSTLRAGSVLARRAAPNRTGEPRRSEQGRVEAGTAVCCASHHVCLYGRKRVNNVTVLKASGDAPFCTSTIHAGVFKNSVRGGWGQRLRPHTSTLHCPSRVSPGRSPPQPNSQDLTTSCPQGEPTYRRALNNPSLAAVA